MAIMVCLPLLFLKINFLLTINNFSFDLLHLLIMYF